MKRLLLLFSLALIVVVAGSVLSRDYTTLHKLNITTDGQPLQPFDNFEPTINEIDLGSDGRYVVFNVYAANLPDNGGLLLHDRTTGITELIDNAGFRGRTSEDGRYIYYESHVNENTNLPITRLYDRVNQTNTIISIGVNGEMLNDMAGGEGMSADGRYMLYTTYATNTINNTPPLCSPENVCTNLYLVDRQNPTVHELINVNTNEDQADNESGYAEISDDGRYVLFGSNATNIDVPLPACEPVPPEEYDPCNEHLYVRDRISGTTTRVNFDETGEIVPNAISLATLSGLDISGNGRYVVFGRLNSVITDPENGGVTEFEADVLVRDIQTNTTEMVNVDSEGNRIPGAYVMGRNSITHDGRFVIFVGNGENTNGLLYIRDRVEDITTIVSQDADGYQGSLSSNLEIWIPDLSHASISSSGDVVVFISNSDVLADAAAGDTTDKIFVSVGEPLSGEPTATHTDVAQTETPTSEPVTPTNTIEPPMETDTPMPPTFTHTAVPPTETETDVPATATNTVIPITETFTPTQTQTDVPATAAATIEPPVETDTATPPAVNLLQNSGFEIAGATPKLAENWKPKNLTKDRRVCNTADVIVAQQGLCAFKFMAVAGETSQISQRIENLSIEAGETVTLSVWVRAKNLSGARVKAVVFYDNDSKDVLKLNGLIGTYAYKSFTTNITTAGSIDSAKVVIQMRNGTGKLWIDQVELMAIP